MDHIRDLLLFMESSDEGLFDYAMLPGGGNAKNKEHIILMQSGGLLHHYPTSTFRLSWEGHEFLDKVRDPEIWKKTKDGANRLNSWGIKLIGEIASGYIKAKASEMGIPLA